jgi:hypothetical protein
MLITEFWLNRRPLKQMAVAFHPPFQLGDSITIYKTEYTIVAVQWCLSATKPKSTLGVDASLLQRVTVSQRLPRYESPIDR